MCHHRSQGLLQFHCGEENYIFTGMPFGLPTAPSVYQNCNNVLSSLMRQSGITNVLYIDDRLILNTDASPHLGWLLTAMATSTGHFLSLNKSELEPKQVINLYHLAKKLSTCFWVGSHILAMIFMCPIPLLLRMGLRLGSNPYRFIGPTPKAPASYPLRHHVNYHSYV